MTETIRWRGRLMTATEYAYLRLAVSEPEYLARKNGPALVAWAEDFRSHNPWADLACSLDVAFQVDEFHEASRRRRARLDLRAKCAERRTYRPIPSRRNLALRIAANRGTSLVNLVVDGYRRNQFSSTLYGLLTSAERSLVVSILGFSAPSHAAITGVVPVRHVRS